jgi:hypothetical protein
MFDARSRYAGVADAELSIDEAGGARKIHYKRRRFIPSDDDSVVLVEHTVRQGERLDNITAIYLNDPTQFWRLCDANGVMRPEELTDETGRRIKIALRAM